MAIISEGGDITGGRRGNIAGDHFYMNDYIYVKKTQQALLLDGHETLFVLYYMTSLYTVTRAVFGKVESNKH